MRDGDKMKNVRAVFMGTPDFAVPILASLIEKINVIKTKKNEKMAFILASDETGKETLVLFPSEYQKYQGLEVNSLVMVNASVTKRFDKYSIIVKMLKKVG